MVSTLTDWSRVVAGTLTGAGYISIGTSNLTTILTAALSWVAGRAIHQAGAR